LIEEEKSYEECEKEDANASVAACNAIVAKTNKEEGTIAIQEEEPKEERITMQPSFVERPILDLKTLPTHLKYAFLRQNEKLPVIISSALNAD